jgi:cytoskeletal protein CcmA (bactofilin family)
VAEEITTLLGKDSAFEGKLSFDGVVRIDGKFSGEIASQGTLVLGPSAAVDAEVSVRTCVIEGHFAGELKATESVEIHAPARVRGNIVTPEIQVDRGVLLDGKCTMTDTGPTSAAEPSGKKGSGSQKSETGPQKPAPAEPGAAKKGRDQRAQKRAKPNETPGGS